jgi:hypothetical protein
MNKPSFNEPTEEQRRQWREEAEALRERKARKLLRLRDLPEYCAWKCMHYRCYNPEQRYYHRYGGRGITVCDRWHDTLPNLEGFWNFLADVGRRPEDEHFPRSIDRIDNDGNYEPRNCRWANATEQNNNQSIDQLRGEKHWCAKRTADEIRHIRSLRTKGLTQQQIADLYNTSTGYISNIINRRSWSHVPDEVL